MSPISANAPASSASPATRMRRAPNRSTANPTGAWVHAVTMLKTLIANPSSVYPTPYTSRSSGNSGGRSSM